MSSNTSKVAAITAATLGTLLTPTSAPRAEVEVGNSPNLTKVTPSVDLDEDVFYSPVSDEALEIAAGRTIPTETGQACLTGQVLSCSGNSCVGRTHSNTRVQKPTTTPSAPKSRK
jgi:hypothetical protein